ncbi:hypothetical protein P171DRAFT_445251 [Karstenula rhodostoma CBS 690.94]|uniref:SAP domain-containing protein n=1 Tax=Karstenula rhodostoma CBS 690.94 TaxID=1392251 RepID=A0A9P4PGT9_9PLEO|nr:hypothetical protein P171DRAFT_445251 [Karstenula rhodostoma CBS 690.94]
MSAFGQPILASTGVSHLGDHLMYASLTASELRRLCKQRGILRMGSARKPDIVEALEKQNAELSDSSPVSLATPTTPQPQQSTQRDNSHPLSTNMAPTESATHQHAQNEETSPQDYPNREDVAAIPFDVVRHCC